MNTASRLCAAGRPASRRHSVSDRTPPAVALLANPLTRDWHLHLTRAVTAHFEWCSAIALRLAVLADDVGPTAGSDVCPVLAGDPEQVGLALDQPDWESMNRKDVKSLERRSVIATQQVLIAQQIGQIGCQRVAYAPILDLRDHAAAQFQTKELAHIEHVPVAGVSPPVQTVGLVPRRDRVIRNETRSELLPALFGCLGAREILRVGPLEGNAPCALLSAGDCGIRWRTCGAAAVRYPFPDRRWDTRTVDSRSGLYVRVRSAGVHHRTWRRFRARYDPQPRSDRRMPSRR